MFRGFKEIRIAKNIKGEPDCGEAEINWALPATFLIHGYNTDSEEANQNFTNLYQKLENSRLPYFFFKNSYLITWLGYINNGLASGKSSLSKFSYPRQILSAKLASKALKNLVEKKSPHNHKKILYIIAHSLGCRLALELLEEISKSNSIKSIEVRLVVLIAAAVPTYFFEKEPYYLNNGIKLSKDKLILYSKHDSVLQISFRFGQTLASEGIFPIAIGYTGEPFSKEFNNETALTINSHSGYFKDNDTKNEILKKFNKPVPRKLDERSTKERGLPFRHEI